MDSNMANKVIERLAESTGVLEAIRDSIRENFEKTTQTEYVMDHLNDQIEKNNKTLDEIWE